MTQECVEPEFFQGGGQRKDSLEEKFSSNASGGETGALPVKACCEYLWIFSFPCLSMCGESTWKNSSGLPNPLVEGGLAHVGIGVGL